MATGKKMKTCSFCGEKNLMWHRTPQGQFYLVPAIIGADGQATPGTTRHSCKKPTASQGQNLPPNPPTGDPNIGPQATAGEGQGEVQEQSQSSAQGQQTPMEAMTPEEAMAMLEELTTQEIEVPAEEETEDPIEAVKKVQVSKVHQKFPELLFWLNMREAVVLVGPAGGFKSTACEKAAKLLKLDFYPQSLGEQTSYSQIFGFVSATGDYKETALYRAFKHGGLYLMDEIDSGNANVLVGLNSALANGFCLFGGTEVVRMHKKFRFAATANTFGNGADRVYVGRNELDAATLDRFQFIVWNYDENLEALIVGTDMLRWTRFVQACRKVGTEHGITSNLFTPRSSIRGAKALRQGKTWEWVEESVLWARMSADDRNIVESNLQNVIRKAA